VPFTRERLAEANSEVKRLEATKKLRDAFDQREGWHQHRLVDVDNRLEHHWASAVLSAAREGDPLAYGPETLQQAHSIYASDLRRTERNQNPQHGRSEAQGVVATISSEWFHTTGGAELSLVVAELEQAMDVHIPSPSAPASSHEMDRLSATVLHPDYAHDIGLGR
jgi:hypothetical protein